MRAFGQSHNKGEVGFFEDSRLANLFMRGIINHTMLVGGYMFSNGSLGFKKFKVFLIFLRNLKSRKTNSQ